MGNCMQASHTSAVLDEALENRAEVGKATAGYDAADADCRRRKRPLLPGGKRGLNVKIVLTMAEMKWLMRRLKEEAGGGVDGAAVEQALEQIQKRRMREDGAREKQGRPWKPSLGSIIECPETQSFNDDIRAEMKAELV